MKLQGQFFQVSLVIPLRTIHFQLLLYLRFGDPPKNDDYQLLDGVETEVDPESPLVVSSQGTPTPPPPDNQLGFESWERCVSYLNTLEKLFMTFFFTKVKGSGWLIRFNVFIFADSSDKPICRAFWNQKRCSKMHRT